MARRRAPLGFGPAAMEAGQHALITRLEDFDGIQAEYVRAWKGLAREAQKRHTTEVANPAVSHERRSVARARIQTRGRRDHCQSVDPVGFSKPDDDLGGYHLVWPRDLVEIVVDGTLKVDTPRGPVWRRYQGDGYGEHPDSGPFDGTGVGRAWPLLTGERAHYEGADFVVCVE